MMKIVVSVLTILASSSLVEAIAETSPQDQVVTATSSASSESSACSASQGKAYNLCMVRGFSPRLRGAKRPESKHLQPINFALLLGFADARPGMIHLPSGPSHHQDRLRMNRRPG
jgi:hypothetical protein